MKLFPFETFYVYGIPGVFPALTGKVLDCNQIFLARLRAPIFTMIVTALKLVGAYNRTITMQCHDNTMHRCDCNKYLGVNYELLL